MATRDRAQRGDSKNLLENRGVLEHIRQHNETNLAPAKIDMLEPAAIRREPEASSIVLLDGANLARRQQRPELQLTLLPVHRVQ